MQALQRIWRIIERLLKEWFLSVHLYNFDYVKLITLSPLDCPEAIEAIDALKKASLAMVRDIQRSDAKQPKKLMNELFGIDIKEI